MLRASRVLLVLSSLCAVSFAAERVGGIKSATAGIMLRAVLAQSLSVSADPQAVMFNSFIGSDANRDFPVTFKTRWVRGPGSVSVVVLSSPGWAGVENGSPVSVGTVGSTPALEIESGQLPFSSDNKNEVLIVRAQVI
jgi:hypothetical protein